jgi:hypothetical protein
LPPDLAVYPVSQQRFHRLIRERAGKLVDRQGLNLPELTEFGATMHQPAWFPVPGMYGGFKYWLEESGEDIRLVVESWCRVAEGSGQRHEITIGRTVLVEEGFV